MKLYRFSPITDEKTLLRALAHIHTSCHQLCKQSFGTYFAVAGNIGIFCHYENEYLTLIGLQKNLTDKTDSVFGKYYRLQTPITFPANNGIPTATYTHLYIRKPDKHHAQVGDIDFYLSPNEYKALKITISEGKQYRGASLFSRGDLDMIELSNPDIDALGYVRTDEALTKL